MVEFLLELTKFDKNMETVTTHPGDLGLLRRVATLIRDHFSGNECICGALDAAVPSFVVGTGVGAVPYFPRWPACLYCVSDNWSSTCLHHQNMHDHARID
jgi:hypothetical protein